MKISGAYRVSERAPDYPDIVPLARALIAANADRVLWAPLPAIPTLSCLRDGCLLISPRCSRSTTGASSTNF